MKNKKSIGLPGGPNEFLKDITQYISIEGYKRYSKDINNPVNIIESGSITMEDVDFPVMGTDNLGNSQMMMPGNNYQFPGDRVFEIPMAQDGTEIPDEAEAAASNNSFLYDLEKLVNKSLGDINNKARDFSENPEEMNNIDNMRHASGGRYAAEAIQQKVKDIPYLGGLLDFVGVDKAAGFIGSNVMGVGHELRTIFGGDERPFLAKLQEMGEDTFNNYVGSIVGSLSIDDSKKDEVIKYLSYNNLLPDGYVRTEQGKKDGFSEDIYFKDEDGKRKTAYQRGGGLLDKTMKCNSCGWSWKAADGGADVSTCHKCGGSALPKAQDGRETYTREQAIARQEQLVEYANEYFGGDINKAATALETGATQGGMRFPDDAAILKTNYNKKIDSPRLEAPPNPLQIGNSYLAEGLNAITGRNDGFDFFRPLTENQITLSEAANVTNPVGAFALDMLDPAVVVSGAWPLAKGLSKAVNKVGNKYLPNAYKLNPRTLKEAQEQMLVRARPVGQNPYINMTEQVRAKEAAGESLKWYQKNLLNPQTNPKLVAREKYFGQWFADNPSDLDFYINPATRNFADDAQIEILKHKLPKSKADQYSVKNFDDAKTLSNIHDKEYILPKDMVQQAERYSVEDLAKLKEEYKQLNTPHWLKGYPKIEVPKQLQLPGSPNAFKSSIDWRKWVKYTDDFDNNTDVIKHLNEIEKTTKANGTWMKNPDGSAFKGTQEEFVIQQSDNFKKAFPNPVVDDAGNPLINYHGSGSEFNVFDESKFYSGTYGKGVYTSPNKDGILKSYANPNKNRTKKIAGESGTDEATENLYELYINSKNPLTTDDILDFRNFGKTVDELPSLKDWKNSDFGKKMLAENTYLRTDDNIISFIRMNTPNNPVKESFIDQGGDFLRAVDSQLQEGVTPFSNQMKSAKGNILFDMSNPNIYKGMVPVGAAAALNNKQRGGQPTTQDSLDLYNLSLYKYNQIKNGDVQYKGKTVSAGDIYPSGTFNAIEGDDYAEFADDNLYPFQNKIAPVGEYVAGIKNDPKKLFGITYDTGGLSGSLNYVYPKPKGEVNLEDYENSFLKIKEFEDSKKNKDSKAAGMIKAQLGNGEYKVSSGDTFYGIANKNNVTWDELKKANPNIGYNNLKLNQSIVIPKKIDKPTDVIKRETVKESVQDFQITPQLLYKQAYVESNLNPKAKNSLGYMGLGQIGKSLINDYKKANKVDTVDPFDPKQNYDVQAWSMNELFNSSFINKPGSTMENRLLKSLASYNWGRGNVLNLLKAQKAKGSDIYNSTEWMQHLPKETKEYIQMIVYDGKPEKRPLVQENFLKTTTDEKYKDLRALYNYKQGGEPNLFNMYSGYINGDYDGTEFESKAALAYDKLNRVYYREAKDAGMNIPNYIMTYVIGNS